MKAVIKVGGKQYIVAENQTLLVDKLTDDAKTVEFEPLMLIDGAASKVGTPVVSGAKVTANVVDPIVAGTKIMVGKFQSKKRVKKITGHRQKHTRLEVVKISA